MDPLELHRIFIGGLGCPRGSHLEGAVKTVFRDTAARRKGEVFMPLDAAIPRQIMITFHFAGADREMPSVVTRVRPSREQFIGLN